MPQTTINEVKKHLDAGIVVYSLQAGSGTVENKVGLQPCSLASSGRRTEQTEKVCRVSN